MTNVLYLYVKQGFLRLWQKQIFRDRWAIIFRDHFGSSKRLKKTEEASTAIT